VDACDSVMLKFKRPLGLIRHDSQQQLDGARASLRPHRPRLIIYPTLLALLLGALIFYGRGASQPEVTLLRGIGAPFELRGDRVHNQIRIKIENRSEKDASYRIELLDLPEAELIAPENPLRVAQGERASTSVFVSVPISVLQNGSRDVHFGIRDEHGLSLRLSYRLLGPSQVGS
jgi:polyferredoxin